MKHVFTLLVLLITTHTFAQTIDTNAVDGRIYVRISASSSIDLANYNYSDPTLNTILTTYGVTNMWTPFPTLNTDLDRTFEVAFSQTALVNDLVYDLGLLSDVDYAEKKPLFRTFFLPNDVQASQWALTKISAVQAWDISTGNSAIKIAIVDNAVSTVHEDLQANIYINTSEIPGNGLDDDLNGFVDDVTGYDVADSDSDPNPPASAGSSAPFIHGTHCAGISSASTDNGIGIASIGFNTSIIPVKCTPDNSASGGNELPNAYDGVYYAIRANAEVISMSWGGGNSSTGQSLISAANSLGIVLVAAAGNSNTDEPFYPAAYPSVISVGSTDISDSKSSFSNFGTTLDVMAPGSGIFSTISGNGSEYGTLSGTSMACPLAAGLCALVLDQHPTYTPAQVKTALQNGCDNIDAINPGFVGMMGAGRINAFQTLSATNGLKDMETANDAVIYPNPNDGSFSILLQNSDNILEVLVSNMMGQVIELRSLTFIQNKAELNLSLPSGVYVVRLVTERGSKDHLVRVM